MAETLRFIIDKTDTPIGELIVVADPEGHLRAVDWTEHDGRMRQLLRLHYGEKGYVLEAGRNPGGLTEMMRAYFAGRLDAIDPLPSRTAGTAFQREVWAALREIPCGDTVSYSALAQRIGRPAAVRAVGMANGANPVGIVVPCHRVVGANGSLTGYGGGIERKRWLLAHEAKARASSAA
ncbi:methylated-DNA--protein-cysteine methyltransferase [Myxococcus stipitatus DSM 14675]|uniref:Methylated-DNA--protein-cysteine methyltransferase n=1 Tax=Myxococcus stipitatus (strain DSM 14675 / JCM 12634 / Mx s8) TaxID=1278073 RepID=L7U7T9_MYXSD|nr:methylated-DNA--[protein]-cysteine S-methyltransferase [Myxococcus stipitatus]AGC43652.1 methylated-DNA--protein-cysteine methyltransferase [Myxococcus stipitatus DSM 14675]